MIGNYDVPEEKSEKFLGDVQAIQRTRTATSALGIVISNQLSNAAAVATLDIQGLVLSLKASGMSDLAVRAILLDDLSTGGVLFGTFRNQVKNTVKSGVGMAGNIGSQNAFIKAGVEEFTWIASSSKPCPDCVPRHGDTGTMEYFRSIGLPASGFSVCQMNCHCQLLPVTYKGENLEMPLMR